MSGRVVLVGAGPGDPDLLTVRAVRELGRAEVLLYDALIAPAILEHASPDCERIDVGKRGDGTRGAPQDGIAALMIEKARAGHPRIGANPGQRAAISSSTASQRRLRASNAEIAARVASSHFGPSSTHRRSSI